MKLVSAAWLGLALSLHAGHSLAAPFTPPADSEVVERLPLATDPAVRQVESLRRQLAGRPGDDVLRLDIAQRYFSLAMAQGDPRLVGYATAALAPLTTESSRGADYWLLRGQLQQYGHQFEPALASLARSSEIDPSRPAPLAWRAAILMVQARYAEAEAECRRLQPLAEPLWGVGCAAYAQSSSGQLQPAFDRLAAAVKTAQAGKPAPTPELLLWSYTRLAEMAIRLQRPDVAEGYFQSATRLGLVDQFLLGSHADFLLDQGRPAEALTLLAGWERSDILLLRLALAGQAVKDPRTSDWARQLRARFSDAALRGDRLHQQEEARLELDIERNPTRALTSASGNYTTQKEPHDAGILMRAALAAGQAQAAQPALDWLRTSRYQDPALDKLADALAAAGARR